MVPGSWLVTVMHVWICYSVPWPKFFSKIYKHHFARIHPSFSAEYWSSFVHSYVLFCQTTYLSNNPKHQGENPLLPLLKTGLSRPGIESTTSCSRGDNRSSGLLVTAFASWATGCDLIPGRDRPKSLELVVVGFPLVIQDYGNSTTTGLPVSG